MEKLVADMFVMFFKQYEEYIYKYYSVMRPVSIGTHPKNEMMDFINYDTRIEVNGRMVWAELYYNRELPQRKMEADMAESQASASVCI